jgi:hypothetical protein
LGLRKSEFAVANFERYPKMTLEREF